jgi:filamin
MAKKAAEAKVDWVAIQENTFLRWCNDMLSDRGRKISNLKTDLKDGIALINILEVASKKSLGKYNKHPKIEMQKAENLILCFNFLKQENVKLVNIGHEDLMGGNLRLILGLIWTLILEYEIGKGGIDELMKWVRSKIPEYNIQNWQKDWNDGRAICALTNAVCPGLIPDHADLDPEQKEANCGRGIDTAFAALRIDKLILPEEMSHPKVDKMAMMTYIAQFRNISEADLEHAREYMGGGKKKYHLLANAYGPGLVEGLRNQPSQFWVEIPAGCEDQLVVTVNGPSDEAKVDVTQDAATGKYAVSYTPTSVGDYEISVTLGGEHIPGSVFHVSVLAKESLGGEGLIRVFFSTTSSTEKGRADVRNLEKLLTDKKVHLRKNFEPWHAVDIMDREDREAVFRRAGTRILPIVFVNDEYIGDYDAVAALEEKSQLDTIMNLSDDGMVSLEEHMNRLKANAEY